MKNLFRLVCFAASLGIATTAADAATLVATYTFNDTLAAVEASAPALVSIDPLSLNGFETAVVNGSSQRVFRWSGDGSSPTTQAGLSLDATGLVAYDNYSVDMTFEFLAPSAFGGGWRRIIDTQNRQSDNGFYVDPSNNLDVYPVGGSTASWTTNVLSVRSREGDTTTTSSPANATRSPSLE